MPSPRSSIQEDPEDIQEVSPGTFCSELGNLLQISWPVGFATFARLAIYTTDAAFIGHIGTTQLTGVTLAQSYTSFLGVLVQSAAYALNSICSQAIGANNPKLAGNWLQLSIVICSILCIPMIVAYFWTEPVVALLDTEPGVASYAQEFNELASSIVWPTYMYMAVRQYFQALQIVMPATIVSFLTIGVNVGLNYLLVFGVSTWGGLALRGSPLATLGSMLFQLGAFLGYAVVYKGYHKPYWGGWSMDSLRKERVREFMKLVVPMTIGNCMNNWGFQIITFISGRLAQADVAVMAICYNIWGILWAFYWGWGLALQVKVGEALGQGDVPKAKRVVKLSLLIVGVLVTVVAGGCVLLRFQLPRIFSTDPDVISGTASVLLILAGDYVMGCLALCGANVLEGMSRNTPVAIVNSISMWVVQLPLCFYFCFWCPVFQGGYQVHGLWFGTLAGSTVSAAGNWWLVATTDWEAMSEQARARSETNKLKSPLLAQSDREDDSSLWGPGGRNSAPITSLITSPPITSLNSAPSSPAR